MSTLPELDPVVVRQQHVSGDAEWQSWLDQIAYRRAQTAQASSVPWSELQYQILLRDFIRSFLPSQSPRLPYYQTSTFRPRAKLLDVEARNSSTPRFPTAQFPGQCGQKAREGDTSGSKETFTGHHAREIAHNDRIKEILDMLGPFNARSDESSTILIAWGETDNCHVLPAKIPHEADDTQQWELIRDTYYAHRGKWRRRLPFFGVKEKLSLAGRSSSNMSPRGMTNNGEFIGTYIKESERTIAQNLRQAIADYIPQVPPCEYNRKTGAIECSVFCAEDIWDEIICPERELWWNRRALSRIESQIPLAWALRNPILAKGNDLLDEEMFYSHFRLLRLVQAWHNPTLRELEFKSLIIEEGWIVPRFNEAIVLIGMVISVALLGKFAFGGWEPAWGAAACVAQVATSLFFYYHGYSRP